MLWKETNTKIRIKANLQCNVAQTFNAGSEPKYFLHHNDRDNTKETALVIISTDADCQTGYTAKYNSDEENHYQILQCCT